MSDTLRDGRDASVPLCNICGTAPCVRYSTNSYSYCRHCGSAECIAATQRGENVPWRGGGWPQITAVDTVDFTAHNINPNDGGPFRLNRPDTYSAAPSSAVWAMRQ